MTAVVPNAMPGITRHGIFYVRDAADLCFVGVIIQAGDF
jgi:hypothetical protein